MVVNTMTKIDGLFSSATQSMIFYIAFFTVLIMAFLVCFTWNQKDFLLLNSFLLIFSFF
jgi:hypothetical protein